MHVKGNYGSNLQLLAIDERVEEDALLHLLHSTILPQQRLVQNNWSPLDHVGFEVHLLSLQRRQRLHVAPMDNVKAIGKRSL